MKIPNIITTILITLSATLHAATSGVFTYEPVGETIRITQVAEGLTGHLEIPSHIDGKEVTHLGTSSLADPALGLSTVNSAPTYTSVSIPNTVKVIDAAAFQFVKLTSVTIPASVEEIGDFAFYGCTITTLTFEGNIKKWGRAAFHDTAFLKTINFHNSMTSLGKSTFFDCPALTHITLPQALEAIEERLFFNCENLVSVSMGPNVKIIEKEAFTHCFKLSSVNLSWGLETIEKQAFYRCDELKTITIPPSVKVIEETGFWSCRNLDTAIFLGDAPEVVAGTTGFSSFSDLSDDFKIMFKEGKAGFTAPTWKSHPSIMIPAGETPAKTWLRGHGLPENTDMSSDPNRDGVSLFTEYAFRLNPNQNNAKAIPSIKFVNNTAKITFFNGRDDVEYTPQHSSTLNNWSSTNLSMTQKSNGVMEASVPTTNNSGFFRIKINKKKSTITNIQPSKFTNTYSKSLHRQHDALRQKITTKARHYVSLFWFHTPIKINNH